MKTVSPEYAAGHLPELLEEVGAGEEILIAAEGRPLARLSPVAPEGQSDEHTGPEAPDEEVEQAFHGD
jgi:antitoxin (DNA-binding transcriptional repressor) of toxin-antitoxin stability system